MQLIYAIYLQKNVSHFIQASTCYPLQLSQFYFLHARHESRFPAPRAARQILAGSLAALGGPTSSYGELYCPLDSDLQPARNAKECSQAIYQDSWPHRVLQL